MSDGEYGGLTRDEYIDGLLGEMHQGIMELAAEVGELRKENRSLRSGVTRVLRVVAPRETAADGDDEDGDL